MELKGCELVVLMVTIRVAFPLLVLDIEWERVGFLDYVNILLGIFLKKMKSMIMGKLYMWGLYRVLMLVLPHKLIAIGKHLVCQSVV